jgi:carbamoyl-phosphate synthase small subunit
MTKTTAYLLLEDGTVFKGKAFGARDKKVGEVVFNTGMTGYQEVMTDPSYCAQIVTMTYPLIGNYGINRDDHESLQPYIYGLVVKEYCDYPSNWRNEISLDEFLQERGIPGIYDIDTRMLTKIIRERGTLKGMIVSAVSERELAELQAELATTAIIRDQVARVSTKNAFHCPGTGQRVVLVDFGSKAGILRELTQRHCDVRVVPHDTSADEILRLKPDGILLSNGPGNPKDVQQGIQMVREVLGKVPLFGICLGHQLFALACGADTEKLKFGHRGANHPVKDIERDVTFLTSQNHGYTVNLESLDGTGLKTTHIAVNDQTIEGLRHLHYPAFSVQFHPEASPGPDDSNLLFDQFMTMMEQWKMNQQQEKGERENAAR